MRNTASLKKTQFQTSQIALTAMLAILSLSACECSLNQTEVERSALNMHRGPDIRSWCYPDESEIAVAQSEARRRFGQFRNAYVTWKPAPQDKENEKGQSASRQAVNGNSDQAGRFSKTDRTGSISRTGETGDVGGKSKNGKKESNAGNGLKKEECFEVKIPVSVLFITEHIWMHVTALDKDTVTGKLDASPELLRMYGQDSVFTIPIAKIEDWAYGNSDSSTGSFTLLPLRKCKLQELNGIRLQNGQPTAASLAACNSAWALEWKKFGNLSLSDWKKLWAQEEQKTNQNKQNANKEMQKQNQDQTCEQEDWAETSKSLVKEVEQSLRKNNATAPSESDVASACGLPLATVMIIDELNQQFDEIMETLAKESDSNKAKESDPNKGPKNASS